MRHNDFVGCRPPVSPVPDSYQSPHLYGRLGAREGTIPMQSNSIEAAMTTAMATTTNTTKPTTPTMPSMPTTIEEMSQEEALKMVHQISSIAGETGNWSLILGSNGKSGRNATGNYSLLAKAIGMTRVHVSRVLKGKVQPSHLTLRKLSEATGISLDDISRFIVENTQKGKEAA